jgi:TRAP-type C4-dicarboxylate transport system permease large subunit
MGIVDIKFEDLVRACPFLIPLIACLLLFTYVPALSTWFPTSSWGRPS